MKIAIVSPYRDRAEPIVATSETSALQFVTEALAQQLSEDGLDVRVYAPSRRSVVESTWKDNLVTIERIARCRGPLAFERLLRAIPADRQVVHLEHELYAYGGLLTALTMPLAMRRLQMRGHRLITTLHGVIPLDLIDWKFLRSYRVSGFPWLVKTVWRLLVRGICHASDVVHVHEANFRDMLVQQYGVKSRIEVIPLGIDSRCRTIDKSAARRSLGVPPDSEIVCFFGFLYKRKGIIEFLNSARQLLERNPQMILLVAGDLPTRAGDATEVKALLASLSDCKRLQAMGFVQDSDVGTILSASDVMILPYTLSMSASGPMTLGAAYGLPLLLSDRFAIYFPEATDLFEPTPKGIVASVERFFSDSKTRERAWEFSLSMFNQRRWSSIAKRLESQYLQLAELI